MIKGLRDHMGNWKENEKEMETVIDEYFREMFRSTNPRGEEIEEVLHALDCMVSEEAKHDLSCSFTEAEVKDALSSMPPLKFPGPDGYPALFYQKYWNILGSSVIDCVLNFLNHKSLPPGLIFTYIVLIPKVKNPHRMNEFRPISLCNVLYKIGSKSLANRLKPVLDSIISPSQSAFVPHRLITDNVLVAFEINHFIRTKSCSKNEYVTVKLDVSKAYDRVEWSFLRPLLLRIGLPQSFVDLIMLSVSSVTYSYMLNGLQFGNLAPERGLRQGDPLSPYLFICVVEAFLALIARAEEDGQIRGVTIAPSAPSISALCFADDTFIFCRSSSTDATALKNILNRYAAMSGQVINFEKTEMTFSKTLQPAIKGWGEKLLSKAGKEVLIKAVLQSIHTYIMSCFMLPGYLVRSIETSIRNFWWGTGTKRSIAWLPWSHLCQTKAKGGLGFRDLKSFNLALLAKQCWRLVTNLDSLMGRILKARYFPNSSFMEASMESRPSATWRSILQARPFLQQGLWIRIGHGFHTSIWEDPWLTEDGYFKPITPRPANSYFPMNVVDLIDPIAGTWDRDMVEGHFWQVDCNRIFSVPIGAPSVDDHLIWHYEKHGRFSVRSCYHLILSAGVTNVESTIGRGSGEIDWSGRIFGS